jgi:signal transduction histidine kinase
MNQPAAITLTQSLQVEFDSIRDQRDLFRSLLLCEPEPLAAFLNLALESVESIRAALRMTARDAAAFRGKIERLQLELIDLEQEVAVLDLPTVSLRLANAMAAINEIGLRAEPSGNALLPVMVTLEELCSHLLIAADVAAAHLPTNDDDDADDDIEASEQRAQPRLAAALRQMGDKLSVEHGKSISLVIMGVEDIPETWTGALFDLLGQLLRNAVEHGIEAPAQRAALTKGEIGTVVIEFVDRGAPGFELNVQDDGAGLDSERIADIAVKLGLLNADTPRPIDSSRIVSLIFHPGVTTSQGSNRRGLGMQIVRDHVQRLGGKLQLAAKRGHYVRFSITLPPFVEG